MLGSWPGVSQLLVQRWCTAAEGDLIVYSPSPSAADNALSPSKERLGRATDPAARPPSNDTAVEI